MTKSESKNGETSSKFKPIVTAIGRIFMIKTDPVNDVMRLVTTSSVINNDVSIEDTLRRTVNVKKKIDYVKTQKQSKTQKIRMW